MGRPKGSKNKVKFPDFKIKTYGEPSPEIQAQLNGAMAVVAQGQALEKASIAAQRAALKAEMAKPLSAAETKKLLAEAQLESSKVRDPQLVVNDAVEQVIKPNWMNAPNQDGCKHFYVKSQRNGESVSFEAEKWQRALQTHKLPSGNVTFKIEGLGMEPGGDTGSAMYRVMIG